MYIHKLYLIEPVQYTEIKKPKHPKCEGWWDYYGEFDCGYGTTLLCEDCKYGLGRKDPEAKCNQIKQGVT